MYAADLLSKRANLTPEREALVYYGLNQPELYTFADLNARSNRLANWMRNELGVQKGDRVSILAYNCVPYLDLFFGLAKLGAILAPLNWRLTANELTFIIDDCGPKALVCGPEFADLLAEMQPQIEVEHLISLDGAKIGGAWPYAESLACSSDVEPDRPALDTNDTHCILYTSGTTGRPKGAMISHRQVLWNCINTVVSWGLTEYDISPVFTPLFHAGGLFAFLTPLFYAGGRVILTRTFDLAQTLQIIEHERCTVILGVPTIFQMWLDAPGFARTDFDHVRFFISGGAPLPLPLLEAWKAAKGGIFRQGYGLTEVGPNCFSMTDEESVIKTGSVGKPIFHSHMRLADPKTGADVSVGETGELQISGPHVTTGYWRNPEATARSLVDGWFYTGDMARQDEHGFFYIAGRFKDMVISGGENVYAAEVEAVIRDHPAVGECALIAKPDEKWGEVGMMIVVLKTNQSTSQEELKAFCAARLAPYKVPKEFVFTDAIPYSPYGKVQKVELRKQYVESEK
ncbi:MAG: long-chain fatty acid--CoA ligase [Chloroflexi bacterium]|nr:long-chain fatty acid--CoA ligase [Chloroflexota bacterium]